MGVPTTVADLSTTASSNSPQGTDPISSSAGPDDYLRAHAAIIATMDAEKADLAAPTFVTSATVERAADTARVIVNRTGAYTGTDICGSYTVSYAGDSVAAISIFRDGANDAGAFTIGTQATGGTVTERMRITSSGNVGIGATPTTRFHVAGATSGAVHVNDTGQLYGTALHNNSGAVTGTTNQYIASGTYTPTVSAATNVAANTPLAVPWTRVGNVVNVEGKITLTPTANTTATALSLSLPIASNLAAAKDLNGMGYEYSGGKLVTVDADAANNVAALAFLSGGTTSQYVYFRFSYEVL